MSRILLFTAGNIRSGAVAASIRSRQTSSASTALRNNITTISSVKSKYSTRNAEPLQGVKRNAKPNADAALGVGIGLAAVAGGILATNKEQDQTFNASNNNGIKNSHAFYGNSSNSTFPSIFSGALSFMPSYIKRNKLVSCEAAPAVDPTADPDAAAAAAGAPTKEQTVKTDGNVIPSTEDEVDLPYEHTKAGMTGGGDERGSFHGLFPLRQLWKPCKPYPLWDTDWDGKELPTNDMSDEELLKRDREIRRRGVTRHIILIRHGQYDETHREDHKRILTKLGRQQAHLTGERIAKLIEGATATTTNENDDQDDADSNKNKALFTPCKVIAMHVSDLARAKETAQIIASHLPESLIKTAPDPLLNEGRPCHNIPGGQARPSVVAKVDECHPRIESAFERYFYRAPPPSPYDSSITVGIQQHDKEQGNPQDASDILASSPPAGSQSEDEEQPCLHEFEIIVGHANVIRYFLCRALQLPPEAWLRLCIFNCSLTYLTIRPTGTVSCRMLGDIGHLPYDHSTFSMHHGFNW